MHETKLCLLKHTRFTYQLWLIDFVINFEQIYYIFCFIYISDQLKKDIVKKYIYIYILWTNIKPTIFFTNRSSIFIVDGYELWSYCGDWYCSLLIVWLHNVNRNCGKPQIRDTLMTSWQVFSLLLFVFLFFLVFVYLLVCCSILKYRKQIIVWFVYNFRNEL